MSINWIRDTFNPSVNAVFVINSARRCVVFTVESFYHRRFLSSLFSPFNVHLFIKKKQKTLLFEQNIHKWTSLTNINKCSFSSVHFFQSSFFFFFQKQVPDRGYSIEYQ